MNYSKALEIAEKAHRGQTRTTEKLTVLTSRGLITQKKKVEPFILHPVRVALNVRHTNKTAVTVALLHDVLEDTEVTSEGLINEWLAVGGVPDGHVLKALHAITRLTDETYFEYIERVSRNEIARVVKIADLTDNLNGFRVFGSYAEHSLVKRYRKAMSILRKVDK